MKPFFKIYWRQLLIAILTVLPCAVLVILGIMWLVESPWFYPAFAVMALAGITVAILGHSLRRSTVQALPTELVPADTHWTPLEAQAWQQVQAIAVQAQTTPPQNTNDIQALADQVARTVARQLHGNADFAWAKFTAPEILRAIELAAHNLRTTSRERIPGIDTVRVSDVLQVCSLYQKHSGTIKLAHWAFRIVRLYIDPLTAITKEVKDAAADTGWNTSLALLHGWMARLAVEELGRAAIDLFSGRLRNTPEEATHLLQNTAPAISGPVPIRIVLAGQVNAGKSSLTNALLGAVQAAVSETPTPAGVKEFRLITQDGLDLVLLDTPGIDATGGNTPTLLATCANADFILWVAQASTPARQADTRALLALRTWFASQPHIKPPPMAMVLTHIDRLSPAREWAPPYDLLNAASPKAQSMQSALAHVAQELGFSDQPTIPVCLRANEPPYNIDALWATIAASLSQAQLSALDRGLKHKSGLGWRKTFHQLRDGGRFVASKMWADRMG